MKLRSTILVVIACLVCSTDALQAQARYAPTAPKPSQLSAAKTVFISNNTAAPLADSDRIYDEIYASVEQLHRFSILPSPDGADLVLEFSRSTPAETTERIALRVIDGKTNVVLWSVSDTGQTKALHGTEGKKNQHDVVDNILDYLAIVTAPGK